MDTECLRSMSGPPAPDPRAPKIVVVGAAPTPLRDFYHRFLWMRWSTAVGWILCAVLAINILFALAYMLVGGVEGMAPTFHDAFFFSVQTLATIGYGVMHPVSTGAHVIVTIEAVVGLLVTALVTGLVFAKFSISSARIVFSKHIALGPMNGVPTLMLRLGNERKSRVVEAQVRLAVVRTEHTREGETFYRMLDLPLARERFPSLARSWTVLHEITPTSPLFGLTPEDFAQQEFEFTISLLGIDETSLQPVYAAHTYFDNEVRWGMRPADMLSETSEGDFVVDVRHFDALVATPPAPDFPYTAGQRVDVPRRNTGT